MANSLHKFMEKVPGRNNEPRDVDAVIAPYGDLEELHGINVIAKSLFRLFTMVRGDYFMDPVIGLGIHRFIFQPSDSITQQELSREVRDVIRKYETRAKITHSIEYFTNKKGFKLNLFINYEGRMKTVSINYDESLLRTIGRESANVNQALDTAI